MRSGAAVIFVLGLIAATTVGTFYFFHQDPTKSPIGKPKQSSPSPIPISTPRIRTTTPNNTSGWVYFESKLYGYSLKRPATFRKVLGNEDLFQATSKDYVEKDGIVTNGAIAQAITADYYDSFTEAWGNVDQKLLDQKVKILSKENATIDGEDAYKFRLEHQDGTMEIRYLTYKSPYSYKISIVVGTSTRAEDESYEQILDDIISTLNF